MLQGDGVSGQDHQGKHKEVCSTAVGRNEKVQVLLTAELQLQKWKQSVEQKQECIENSLSSLGHTTNEE